jgi:hypothetical protein
MASLPCEIQNAPSKSEKRDTRKLILYKQDLLNSCSNLQIKIINSMMSSDMTEGKLTEIF